MKNLFSNKLGSISEFLFKEIKDELLEKIKGMSESDLEKILKFVNTKVLNQKNRVKESVDVILDEKKVFYAWLSDDGEFLSESLDEHFEETETPYKLTLFSKPDRDGHDGEFEFIENENVYDVFRNQIVDVKTCCDIEYYDKDKKQNNIYNKIITRTPGKLKKNTMGGYDVVKKAKVKLV